MTCIRCGSENNLEEHHIIEQLNTPELIRERGTYLSYWTDRSTRYLPRRIPTKEEVEQERQFNLLLTDLMKPDYEIPVGRYRQGVLELI